MSATSEATATIDRDRVAALTERQRTRLRERTRGVLSKRELEDNLVAVVAATLRDAAQPLRDA
jgi:hypothetical protein